MSRRELEERPWQRSPRRVHDAEVGREACADQFRGFGPACSPLEEPQEEPGNYLGDGFVGKVLFSPFHLIDTHLRRVRITGPQLPQGPGKVLRPLFKFVLDIFSEIGPKRTCILSLRSELGSKKKSQGVE